MKTGIRIILEGLRGETAITERGYQEAGDCIMIEGTAVQFLPIASELEEEAVQEARETQYGETITRVMRAEHLIAICLKTSRPKDRLRVQC